jgi:hypothetical protein
MGAGGEVDSSKKPPEFLFLACRNNRDNLQSYYPGKKLFSREVKMMLDLRIRKLVMAFLIVSLSACGGSPVCDTANLQSPNLDSPADYSVVGSLLPTLNWNYPDAGCHPKGYRIDLSPDQDFADTTLSGGTGNPSLLWSPGSDLEPGSEYYWKVAAINDYTLGPASVYRRFFTGPYCDPASLAAPTLVWPANGETVNTTMPGLHWANGNAGCIPQGYGIHLSSDPTFADTTFNGGTGNPDQTWYPGPELADCNTYYWHVFAGIDTTFGPESATRSFRTDAHGTCLPTTGQISGMVWHDLCALPDGPVDIPPPGCVDMGGGEGLGANGVHDPDEPGIAGVHVKLGQGACMSSVILQTFITGADGAYSFNNLPAGTYCVFVDSLESDNVPVLIPGAWTHPMRWVNPIHQAVILAPGEHRAGIVFGWDYQFLPAPPTPTPTPAFTPTPTLAQPLAPFFKATVKPNHIYYRGNNCGDKQAQFQVQVSDPKQIAGVWLFVRLIDKTSQATTGWSEALVMAPMGSGWYSYLLLSEAIPDFTKFKDSLIQYQFVAYDKSFARVAASDVLWDVELSACGK